MNANEPEVTDGVKGGQGRHACDVCDAALTVCTLLLAGVLVMLLASCGLDRLTH